MDTPYTFVQLVQLFFKACELNHENSNKKMCDGFYRDKDEKYFRNILNHDETKGTMVCMTAGADSIKSLKKVENTDRTGAGFTNQKTRIVYK